jgi:Arc/MetJ-type ribon-helix-helix transcriptional regulator
MASTAEQKSHASGGTAGRRGSDSARASQARQKRGGSGATSVAQVRLRPDELADLQQVMQTLNLHSLSDALREGLRLLSREATEVAAAQEIRDFYQGAQAPTPAGVLPMTADELAAADETEW